MLLMATSRRIMGGKYGNEEQTNHRFDYLYDYDGQRRGQDGFNGRGKREFERALLSGLESLRDNQDISTPKVGIYLHGYNNDWQDSLDELWDLHNSLTPVIGYEPVLVGFSWPSTGRTIDYISDREEARDSVPAFTRFLRDINGFLVANERNCFSTSFCIAHSMGNYLLRKGFEYLSDHLGTPVGRKMFDETVMIGPDLSSTDIEVGGKGQYIAQFSRRVHVYYSRHDRALKASSAKRFGGRRLGRHGAADYGNLPGNVVLVNAEKFANEESVKQANLIDREGKGVSVHSSHRYHPEILADINHVISSRDRDVIPTRKEDPQHPEIGGNHYALT